MGLFCDTGQFNDFLLHFSLIFEEALSENVVAMATREGLSFQLLFQNVTYTFLGKSQTFKKKRGCYKVMLQKLQGGGGGGKHPCPNRVKSNISLCGLLN